MNRLNTLLHVLDRADEALLTRQPLLEAVTALDTGHPADVLEGAVEAHLAEQEVSPSPLMAVTPPKGFSFPWKRPTNPEEQQKRLKLTRWLRWLDKAWFDDERGTRLMRNAFIGGTILGGPVLGPPLYFLTRNPSQVPIGVIFIGGALIGLLMGGMTFIYLLHFFSNKRLPYLPFLADLPRAEDQYLQHADTRTYLRATLSSSIPTLLGGDVCQLETMMRAHDQVSAQSKAKAEAEQAVQQQQEKERQQADHLSQRDTRLASLLTEPENKPAREAQV
jgi:hypothetical protein